MMVALAGGVGGARLAVGLAAVLPPPQLTVVVNTGDDFEHLGLDLTGSRHRVCTLAGVNNQAAGWGRKDETWSFMRTLEGSTVKPGSALATETSPSAQCARGRSRVASCSRKSPGRWLPASASGM